MESEKTPEWVLKESRSDSTYNLFHMRCKDDEPCIAIYAREGTSGCYSCRKVPPSEIMTQFLLVNS
mgnify:CR=1 FL=1